MEGLIAPNPTNLDNNDNNGQANPNDTPAGQPAPHQPPPNQPAGQPATHQPAPANPASPTVPVPNLQPIPNQLAPQIIHHQMVNWYHFKPEFAGKPEEDVEAHLLYTDDWMTTHNFEEDVKVPKILFDCC